MITWLSWNTSKLKRFLWTYFKIQFHLKWFKKKKPNCLTMFTFESYLMLMDFFSLDSSYLCKKNPLPYILKPSLSTNLVNFGNKSFRTYHISPLSSAPCKLQVWVSCWIIVVFPYSVFSDTIILPQALILMSLF